MESSHLSWGAASIATLSQGEFPGALFLVRNEQCPIPRAGGMGSAREVLLQCNGSRVGWGEGDRGGHGVDTDGLGRVLLTPMEAVPAGRAGCAGTEGVRPLEYQGLLPAECGHGVSG